MDALISFALCVFVFIVIFWYTRPNKLRSNPPPGPWSPPLVGNIFSVDTTNIHMTFAKLSEKYGKIFRVSLLGNENVVINDVDLLRKAFLGEEYGEVFNDKPDTFLAKYILFNCDIGFGGANKCTYTLRKMLQKGLKVFGDGVLRFEHQVIEELDRLVVKINTKNGQDIDICPLLKKSIAYWMSSLLTGKKANPCDSEIIWDFVEHFVALGTAGEHYLMTILPIMIYLPGKPGRLYRNCIEARDKILQRFFYQNVNEADAFAKKADGLAAALIQMQQEQNQRAGYKVVKDLRGTVLDIFVAGTDNNMTILVNSIAILLKYPECHEKLKLK